MAATIKQLIQPKQIENANTEQYIVSDGTRIVIDAFSATNTSGGAITMSINLIPSYTLDINGFRVYTADNTNLIIKDLSIAAGETYTFPELVGLIVDSGGAISTVASANNSLTVTASGREIV